MRVAIVGAGISGSSVMQTILHHPSFGEKDRITVYEANEQWGTGMPYKTDDEVLMLNSNPIYLSVEPERPDGFVQWLKGQPNQGVTKEGLPSRQTYGDYLKEQFQPDFSHPQVQLVPQEVIDFKMEDLNRARLKTKEGWSEGYDAVVFAIGHAPYKDDYSLTGTKNYIQNPYPVSEKIANIDSTQRIGIVGTGTTSVDMMRYFMKEKQEHSLTFFVRSRGFFLPLLPFEGELAAFRLSREWIEASRDEKGYVPLDLIRTTIKEDLEAGGVSGRAVYEQYQACTLDDLVYALETNDQDLAYLQEYVGEMGRLLPYLFQSLSLSDRTRYMEEDYRVMLLFRSITPYKSAERIASFYQKGKLELLMGIVAVTVQEEGTFLVEANESREVDVLVNATGFDTRFEALEEKFPVLKQARLRHLAKPYWQNQYVAVDWPACHLLTEEGDVLPTVFFIGPLIRGVQHENNDAFMLIHHAREVANGIMDALKK